MTLAPERSINRTAVELFRPIAGDYERWGAILSMGQDPRWRSQMVARLDLPAGGRVLDVAAGTGAITRLVEARGCDVIALDQSAEMLAATHRRGSPAVRATGERLPFPDGAFDAVTFSYLLRYVADPLACMRELARVLRPGGSIGMVEFGRPRGFWGPWWTFYTQAVLPAAGRAISPGWREVGEFLNPSIEALHRRFPGDALRDLWCEAGLTNVLVARPSLGGGLIMWGRKP